MGASGALMLSGPVERSRWGGSSALPLMPGRWLALGSRLSSSDCAIEGLNGSQSTAPKRLTKHACTVHAKASVHASWCL